jgi:dTDP-glucose 4,6-dehydratase
MSRSWEFEEAFAGRTVLVTGAGGLLGRALSQELRASGARVLAFQRSADWLEKPIQIEEPIDYIVHLASPTASRDFVERPVEVIHSICEGTRRTLELAKEKSVKGYLFASSLEAYGLTDPHKESVAEHEFGVLDPMGARSSYPEAKRLAECLCAAYAREFGVPAKVARLAQCIGDGIPASDKRVIAQFAQAVRERHDIVLKTTGETLHNYCYTGDAARAMLVILLQGANGEAYNVANRNAACTIREMAELACRLFPEAGIRVRLDLSQDASAYPPPVVIRLNAKKLESLGWKPTVGLEEMLFKAINDK